MGQMFDAYEWEKNRQRDGGIPIFEYRAEEVRDPKTKEVTGYENVEWVKIHLLGDNKSVVEKRVTDADREKYARQYAAFKAGAEVPPDGTPIEEYPPLSPAEVKALKSVHCHTVEGFLELSDQALNRLGPGWLTKRKRAEDFLVWRKNREGETETLRKKVEELEAKLAELTPKRTKREPANDSAERSD